MGQLEDLDNMDRKAEQKAAKKASEEKKKKQAAETAKAKDKQPLTIESHHVTDWEMEDMDPNSVLEMIWENTPALTSKQLELLNHNRDRAVRLRLAKSKKSEAMERHTKRLELEEMADHLKGVLITRLFNMLDEETTITFLDSDCAI